MLNDDCVASGNGFDTHLHSNMEIISIPLAGDLEHKDSRAMWLLYEKVMYKP